MNARERLRAVLAGRPADRVPRALWLHHPQADFDRAAFVAATLAFHRRHVLDLMKIGPRSSYPVRDYGARDEFAGDYLGRARYLNQVIREPDDWLALRPLDPRAGWLGQTGACVRDQCAHADPALTKILTIFSPMTQAKNLAGAATLMAHWRAAPGKLRAGLETLARSTIAFVRSLADQLLDGLFFAIQECGLADIQPDYLQLAGDLHCAVLNAVRYPFNVLHLHGAVVDFDRFARYPVSVLHWDEREAGLTLAEGRARFHGLVSGGVDWPADGWTDDESVRLAVRAAIERNGPERLLLSAGCVIPYRAAPEHIDAFCQAEI